MKKPSTAMPLTSASTQAERDAANRTHHSELIGHTLDSATYGGHGHAVGSQGKRGHTMVPNDSAFQGSGATSRGKGYIPQAALNVTTKDGAPGFDVTDIVAITDIIAIARPDFEGDPDLDSREQRRAMQQRHVQMVLRLQALLIGAMQEMEQRIVSGEPLNLTMDECRTLLDLGRKLAPSWTMSGQMLKLLDPSGRKPN